jgi:hypothetical protein
MLQSMRYKNKTNKYKKGLWEGNREDSTEYYT